MAEPVSNLLSINRERNPAETVVLNYRGIPTVADGF